MVKRHTTLNIDDELMIKAKEKGVNVSEAAEQAILDKLGEVTVVIKNSEGICDFCGKSGEMATRDDLTGLTWLYPDERWICEDCLIKKGKHII